MIIDVDHWNPRYDRARVWLNGDDVSVRCVYADDGIGMVKLYKTNDKGGIMRPPTLEIHFGDVRIELPAKEQTA